MDSSSNNKNTSILPNDATEGELEEKMGLCQFEVMDTTVITTNLASDTETSKAIVSNLDQTVSDESKSDEKDVDLSKTRESPDVSFDNESNKESLTKEDDSSAVMQNTKTDETIRLSRESPEVLSDLESERMDENENAICNSEHVQDAFVFCPMMGSIQMESILAQGFFLSEQEMTQMEESRHSIHAKFTHSLLKRKIPQKTNCKQLKMS